MRVMKENENKRINRNNFLKVILLDTFLLLFLTVPAVCSGMPENSSDSQNVLDENLLQGTWEYFNEEEEWGERFIFDDGDLDYTFFLKDQPELDTNIKGTYKVTDSGVVTTLNDHEELFEYELKDDELILTKTYSDKDNRIYTQIAKNDSPGNAASKKENHYSGEKAVGEAGTSGEKRALETAEQYLSFTAFSYNGLVKQLEFEGFTRSEACYGADHCGADWKEQAVKMAEQYLDYTSFSKSGLVDQLVFEGFTREQAEYGVNKAY